MPGTTLSSRLRAIPGADAASVIFVAASTFGLSLARVLSLDEIYWLAIARRMFRAGDLPYFDLLDNKGPLLYVLIGAADLLPIGEELGMALLFSAAGVTASIASLHTSRSIGSDPRCARWVTVVAVLSMAALSNWAVTVEFISAALLLAALAVRSDMNRLMLCVSSALVDARSAVLGVVILYFTTGPNRRRPLYVYLGLAAAAAFTVFAIPELRLAFVDYSLSNRAAGMTPRLVALLLISLAPMATALVLFDRSRPSPLALWLAGSAALVGVASLLPFSHYFTQVVIALPLVLVQRQSSRSLALRAVGLVVVLVISAASATEIEADRSYMRAAEPLSGISHLIRPDDRIAVWSAIPHFYYRWAPQTVDFAPSVVYLGRDLPQHETLVRDFVRRIEAATVVIVAAPLDVVPLTEHLGDAQHEVARLVEAAECETVVGTTIVYRFEGC